MIFTKPKEHLSIASNAARKQSYTFNKDKFAYSSGRRKATKNILVSILSIIVCIIVSIFIAMIVYDNGSLFGSIIAEMFTAPFENGAWKTTFAFFAVFAIAALSFICAQKVGLFNIGISGQMLFAGQVITILSWYMTGVPNGLGQILMILIAMAIGGGVALIIGLLRVYLNINEVISCIMVNWIVYYAGTYMVKSVGTPLGHINAAGTATDPIAQQFQLSIQGSGTAAGSWIPLLIITLLAVLIIFLLLNKSVFGKKVSGVGMSNTGSQYAGINVQNKQLVAMLISGILAGLLGAVLYTGEQTTISASISARSVPQEGFNGISVGLISMCNPVAVLPVSYFFGMIYEARAAMAETLVIDSRIADLMFGIIVYGAAIISAFYYFTPYIWFKRFKYGKKGVQYYKDYINAIELESNQTENDIRFVKTVAKAYRKTNKAHNKLVRYEYDNRNHLQNKAYDSYMKKHYKLFAIYCNETGAIPKVNKKKYQQTRKQLMSKYLELTEDFKFINKVTELMHKYDWARDDYKSTLNTLYCHELFYRYNIKNPIDLQNKTYLKLVIINMKNSYSLKRKLYQKEFEFNWRSAKDAAYPAKHPTYYQTNNNLAFVNDLNNMNTKAYEKYLRYFEKNVTYDYASGIEYINISKRVKTQPEFSLLELPVRSTNDEFNQTFWQFDNHINDFLNHHRYVDIIRTLNADQPVVQKKTINNKKLTVLKLKNTGYVLLETQKPKQVAKLKDNDYRNKIKAHKIWEIARICQYKQDYVIRMALINKQTEYLNNLIQNYHDINFIGVKGVK